MVSIQNSKDVSIVEIIDATVHDLEAILALQKLAYQSEAELLGDYSIPPLTQTLDDIMADFRRGKILKAVEDGEIIGSVRVYFSDNTLYIGKLIVSPPRQNQGIGTALLQAAEALYPKARYELFTSDKSERNLYLYVKNGYTEFKRELLSSNVDMVFLEKCSQCVPLRP